LTQACFNTHFCPDTFCKQLNDFIKCSKENSIIIFGEIQLAKNSEIAIKFDANNIYESEEESNYWMLKILILVSTTLFYFIFIINVIKSDLKSEFDSSKFESG
jgi:hypothetical protein